MSTRTSLYFYEERVQECPRVETGIHVYREMHDDCIHLQIYRANSEVNVVLPKELWSILQKRLVLLLPELLKG